MTTSPNSWWTKHTEITDEMVAASKKSLGRGGPLRNQWNEDVTRDTIFHAAIGYGDDNPLWLNKEYASKSKWGTRLAPPSFVQSITYGTRYPEDPKTGPKPASMLSGLPGIGSFWLGAETTWYGPLKEGDHVKGFARSLASIDSKGPQPGDRLTDDLELDHVNRAWREFMGPWKNRTLMQCGECAIFREPKHELAVKVVEFGLRIPRGLSVDGGRYAKIELPHYSDDDVKMILDCYRKETRRGSKPLYYEDVKVGDELPKTLRGPLSVTSMRAYGAAVGSNFAMGDALLFRYLGQTPGANCPHPDTNVPDVPNRVHWDTDLARTLGMPRGYDFGPMRYFWMGSYVTDWIGDSAYLHKLAIYFPSPLFLWELFWMGGRVISKTVLEAGPAVDIELWGDNQRGERVTFGHAIAIVEKRGA